MATLIDAKHCVLNDRQRWNKWMLDKMPQQSCSSSFGGVEWWSGLTGTAHSWPHLFSCLLNQLALSVISDKYAHHLHGNFILIIGLGQKGLNTPLVALIYFFLPIKLHVSLDRNCFLGKLLMWSDLLFSLGIGSYFWISRKTQTGQQTFWLSVWYTVM